MLQRGVVSVVHDDRLRVGWPYSRGEQMIYSGTDPGSYITKYNLVYEEIITEIASLGAPLFFFFSTGTETARFESPLLILIPKQHYLNLT